MLNPKFRKRILDRVTLLFVGYVLALLLARIFESRLIYLPNYEGRLSGDWHPPDLLVQDVWLTTSDGIRLHTWWIPNPKSKFTFLAFHGNAGNIANRAVIYQFLAETPANVLAVEYRGYGKSEGKPSEAGLYKDADAAYQHLVTTKGIDPKTILSFGQSLGTSVAAHLAAQHEVGGLILEAPFPSAAQVTRNLYWFLPGLNWLMYSQFETGARVKELHAPVLIVHCDKDPVIPFIMGQRVYALAHQPKYFLEIKATCHEEASLYAPTRYRTGLQEFLTAIESSRHQE
jgi:fermentation-respiration switch protein FrsA (DUF1100 family)